MSPGPSAPAPAVDPMAMRRAMGRFPTGVAVVTTTHDDHPHGMTVNPLASVSLDPPLLLACLTTGARTTDAVVERGRFMVNILSARQGPIAMRFAQRGEEHFAGLDTDITGTPHSVPAVPGALLHADCAVDRVLPAGDHLVVFGAVEYLCTSSGIPRSGSRPAASPTSSPTATTSNSGSPKRPSRTLPGVGRPGGSGRPSTWSEPGMPGDDRRFRGMVGRGATVS